MSCRSAGFSEVLVDEAGVGGQQRNLSPGCSPWLARWRGPRAKEAGSRRCRRRPLWTRHPGTVKIRRCRVPCGGLVDVGSGKAPGGTGEVVGRCLMARSQRSPRLDQARCPPLVGRFAGVGRSPSTWCTAPPVVNASVGTARLVDTKGNQYVRQRHQHPVEPHGSATRRPWFIPRLPEGEGCENFRAYSRQTPVDST